MAGAILTNIRSSAAAGLEITAHEQPLNFYDSRQVGYVIRDPATGAGCSGQLIPGTVLVNHYTAFRDISPYKYSQNPKILGFRNSIS